MELINTHKFVKTYQKAKDKETQAEAIINVMQENNQSLYEKLATKTDLADLKIELKSDIATVNSRLDKLEGRFNGLEGRFDGLETKFDGLETKFGGLEAKFDGLESKFDGLESRMMLKLPIIFTSLLIFLEYIIKGTNIFG